jgi:hypothetical protein
MYGVKDRVDESIAIRLEPSRAEPGKPVQSVKLAKRMTDEDIRRSKLVAAAAEAQSAWQRLYDRILQLEFDGYAGVDLDLFPRVMEAVLNRYQTERDTGDQTFETIRQLYDEMIAELDRRQPRRT